MQRLTYDGGVTDKTRTPHELPVAEAPDPEPADSPTPGSLVVFGGDDEFVCVDDTCVPAGATE